MDTITLSCRAGRFLFYKGTPLSHMKLIRDTVMSQFLRPAPNTPKIKSSSDAVNFCRSYCEGSIYQMTPFSFYPAPKTMR